MTARFIPADYPGGRICLASGGVTVGAVFPPVGQPRDRLPWVWRLWVNGNTWASEGRAKTELAARTAILSAWREFLQKASLCEEDVKA